VRGVIGEIFRPHSHDIVDSLDAALESDRRGIRAVAISFAALMVTAAVQVVIVVVTGSVALLADTIHNFSDAFTAIPLFIAFRLGRRAANRRYTYGYRRAEDLAGLFVLAMIAASAVVAAWQAIDRLVKPPGARQSRRPVRRRARWVHRKRARRSLPHPRRSRHRLGRARR
jgi:divalent metal cation (Fe/Co/Zn/Cd) transporter